MNADNLYEVFSWLGYGSAYKTITRVCRGWYKVARELYPDADTTMANHLATLVLKAPTKVWSHYSCRILLGNQRITDDIIYSTPDLPWNNQLTTEYGDRVTCLQRGTRYHGGYIGLSIDYVLRSYDPNVDHIGITMVPGVTMKIIKANPDMKWDYEYVSRVIATPDDIREDLNWIEWKWNSIAMNPTITPEFIMANPDYPWAWGHLHDNPNFTWEFYLETQYKPWNIHGVIRQPWCPFEFARGYLDNRFYFWAICQNPNIPVDFILENIDSMANYVIAQNPVITVDIVKEYLSDHIASYIAGNPNFQLEQFDVIGRDSDGRPIPGAVFALSGWRGLTWKYVMAHLDYPWDWYRIAGNEF